MNYNPYAAPQAGPPPMMGAPPPQQGGAQPWDIGEVISLAFDQFKRCWGVLVGTLIVYAIIAAIPGAIVNGLAQSGVLDADTFQIVNGVVQFLSLFISAFFQTGIIRLGLAAVRGGEPQFGDLFSGGSRFLAMLGGLILIYIAAFFSILLLVIPVFIVMPGLALTTYFIADANMGPIEAMKASWNAMNGSKMKLFLYGLVGFLIAIVGLIACCVGVIPASIVVQLGMAIIYVRLSGRGTTPSGFDPSGGGGGGGFAPAAPGGFGAPPGGMGGGYGGPPQGGYGGPPQGGAPGGGYGGPPQGGGGYGPPGGGGGYGGPPGGGMPPGGGGGYGGPPGGGGGYGGGGGGGAPPGGGGYGGGGGAPPGGGGYGPPGGGGGGGYGGGGAPPGGGGYGGPPGY